MKKFRVSVATTYHIDEEDAAEDEKDALEIAGQMLWDDIDCLEKGNGRVDDIFSFHVEEVE